MQIHGRFPQVRMRRMRRDDFTRRLMREHVLTTNDLIYPVFIIDGKNRTVPVDSMPGVKRYTVDQLLRHAEAALREVKLGAEKEVTVKGMLKVNAHVQTGARIRLRSFAGINADAARGDLGANLEADGVGFVRAASGRRLHFRDGALGRDFGPTRRLGGVRGRSES